MRRCDYLFDCSCCNQPTMSRAEPPLCKSCTTLRRIELENRKCVDCGTSIYRYTMGERCHPCHQASRCTPVPADFAEQAGQMNSNALSGHYDVSATMVARWIKESGIRPVKSTGRPVPKDFARNAPNMTQGELVDRYLADRRVIQRWCALTGVEMLKPTPKPPKPKPIPRPAAYAGPKSAFVGILPHDSSIEGRAADHLRCATRAAIYRCTERGRADLHGTFWRYGNVVLTRDELLARAERHGFTTRWAA